MQTFELFSARNGSLHPAKLRMCVSFDMCRFLKVNRELIWFYVSVLNISEVNKVARLSFPYVQVHLISRTCGFTIIAPIAPRKIELRETLEMSRQCGTFKHLLRSHNYTDVGAPRTRHVTCHKCRASGSARLESLTGEPERPLSRWPFYQPEEFCRAVLAQGLKQTWPGPMMDKNVEGVTA